MGSFAEDTATAYQFTRAEQDAYATESLQRAKHAASNGAFAAEIVPVLTAKTEVTQDELPQKADAAKIPKLKPAFRPDGTITAANASSISDGAAALVLMRASDAKQRGAKPLAVIAGHAGYAQEPGLFTTAPVGAIERLLAKLGWRASDVELWEINEAFAMVAMVALRELGLPHDAVNVNGGACALGHPIGASGARIIVTLLHAMQARGARRGIASLCIGGGEATAVALQLV